MTEPLDVFLRVRLYPEARKAGDKSRRAVWDSMIDGIAEDAWRDKVKPWLDEEAEPESQGDNPDVP